MEAFLKIIAREIVAHHAHEMEKVVVVLPGNRAGVYLRKFLSEEMGRPFMAPRFFIFPSFIQWYSGKRTVSNTELVYMLYEAYCSACGSEAEPFLSFVKWADTALKDFNDADQYLVKGNQLFRDLRDYKEIDNWSFTMDPLTAPQEHYLQFWNRLVTIFEAFHRRMHETEKYSYAYLTRLCSEGTMNLSASEEQSKFWFVGLSSLSPAEDTVVQMLVNTHQAQVRMDADRFYIDQPYHEAGMYLRAYRNKHKLEMTDLLRTTEKEMVTHECTTSYGEALALCEYLMTLQEDELRRTAIILSDEKLLHVFLHRLPPLPVPVNIALGTRLDKMAVTQLMAAALQLHRKRNTKGYFHFSDVWFFIRQPALLPILQSDVASIGAYMRKKVWRRIGQPQWDELCQQFPDLKKLEAVFNREIVSVHEAIALLQSLLTILDEIDSDDRTWQAGIKSIGSLLGDWKVLIQRFSFIEDLAAFETVFKLFTSRETVTFQGDPLNGLQVLNMVESRAVDFDILCIVGANDDILPGSSNEQSLIPYDLRVIHKMPTYAEREATYSYTLYRLLHRAKHIHFFYSTISDEFNGTERSRYITQLMEELPSANPQFKIREEFFSLKADESNAKADEVENEEHAQKRMRAWLASGISPTALNKLNACPLDFYYRYIVSLGEEEEMEETISSRTLGIVVHEVLEHFYQPRLQRVIADEEFNDFFPSIEQRVKESIERNYAQVGEEMVGYNRLVQEVAVHMVKSTLEADQRTMRENNANGKPHLVMAVELELKAEVPVEKWGFDSPIHLRGKIDRMDTIGNDWVVIDYKTGSVDEREIKLKSDNIIVRGGDKGKGLQLFTYLYLMHHAGKDLSVTQACIFALANRDKDYYFSCDSALSISTDQIDLFEQELVQLVQETLFGANFAHNPESKYCEYCRTNS